MGWERGVLGVYSKYIVRVIYVSCVIFATVYQLGWISYLSDKDNMIVKFSKRWHLEFWQTSFSIRLLMFKFIMFIELRSFYQFKMTKISCSTFLVILIMKYKLWYKSYAKAHFETTFPSVSVAILCWNMNGLLSRTSFKSWIKLKIKLGFLVSGASEIIHTFFKLIPSSHLTIFYTDGGHYDPPRNFESAATRKV